MEYLITYGLALFVILVVLAILVAVVLPSLKAPDLCQFTQPGFTCNQKQHVLVADSSDNVRLLFQLDNGQGGSVKVKGLLCTDNTAANVRVSEVKDYGLWAEDDIVLDDGTMASGGSREFGAVEDREVECVKSDGTAVVLSPGSSFKGTLAVVYTFENDLTGAPDRLAVATLSGTVQAENE